MDSRRFYDTAAAFYDADYGVLSRVEDVAFYVELARECGGPVLEMGCGSGRVLLPTARAGVEITGLDGSPEMLANLRRVLADEPEEVRRRVRLVEGDIRDADAGGRFALVTSPFRVVQHLVPRADQRAWLRNVARHLAPGGNLVFDVYQPDFGLIVDSPVATADLERREDGVTLRRFSWADHQIETQTCDLRFEWVAEEEGGGGGRTLAAAQTTTRWFTRPELENLLELEGFEATDVWGAFDRTPFGPGAEEIIVRAVRPTASGNQESQVGPGAGGQWYDRRP
jgi:SAM-dependent methyltransferase